MIKIIDLKKKFYHSEYYITNGVNLTVNKGESLCILGMSGEGKSVLLKQIAGLLRPTSGVIFLDNINITMLKEDELHYIYDMCGYVFQFAALIDSMTIYENIALPLIEKKLYNTEYIADMVSQVIEKVNLKPIILHKYPSEISGGMKKRVGLARTLMLNPSIILYDEPTSGLDPVNTTIIHELMKKMQVEQNLTSIVVSHDLSIFNYVDQVAFLYKGSIYYTGSAKTIHEVDDPIVKQFISGMASGPINS
jgi:phospholipid/cholesterol/gamma-HCH transport system ATP-binding protein